MNTTQTLPPAPALADTNAYRAAPPPQRSRVVVVPGAGANPNRELEAQLRRRLRFVSVLVVGTLAANFFLTIPLLC